MFESRWGRSIQLNAAKARVLAAPPLNAIAIRFLSKARSRIPLLIAIVKWVEIAAYCSRGPPNN